VFLKWQFKTYNLSAAVCCVVDTYVASDMRYTFACLEVDFGASIYSVLSCLLPCTYLLSKSSGFHFSPHVTCSFIRACVRKSLFASIIWFSPQVSPFFSALSVTRHVYYIKTIEAGRVTYYNPTFAILTSKFFILCCCKVFAYGGMRLFHLFCLLIVFGIILWFFHFFLSLCGSCQLHMNCSSFGIL
jgi:hypothetical protein